MSSPSRRALLALPITLPWALTACGPLPQPFRGRPGEVARRLAQPPAYRLAVPAPTSALLPDADAAGFAEALAQALAAAEIPAVSDGFFPLDWMLVVAAEREGGQVVPRYAVRDADGNPLGLLVGRGVAERDWAQGGEAVRRAAADAAPGLATLLGRIDAQRRTGDESAAGAGPPVLRVLPVRGAPGDGNRSLTERLRERLAILGFQVQEGAQGAGFAVQGVVTMARGETRGTQRVEIVWTVSRRDGWDLGRVVQLNEVPAGSLDRLWGDVAYVVAEEAAGGVRQVVLNAGGFADAGQPRDSAR